MEIGKESGILQEFFQASTARELTLPVCQTGLKEIARKFMTARER